MKDKWDLCYIDLFAGCGRCRVRDSGKEIDGSALIALKLKYPFRSYYFVDLDPKALSSLSARIKGTPAEDRVILKEGDCNEIVDEILEEIPQKGLLCVALIDPTGLHIRFQTVVKLTQGRRIDLIITFPEGMAMKRNLEHFLKQDESLLDSYMGNNEWRELYVMNGWRALEEHRIGKGLIDLYRKNLRSLGYRDIKLSDELLIRSSEKRLPLYYLLFASKHQLGNKFWSRVREIEPSGQQRIKFNNPSNALFDSPQKVTGPKIRIHQNEYLLLNGKRKRLAKRVSDGSIITRFDKTPLL